MKASKFPIRLAVMIASLLGAQAQAAVEVALLRNNLFQVLWKDEEIVAPSRPELRKTGGGRREVFDPTTREFRAIEMSASQGVLFTVVNKRGEPVFLGDGTMTSREVGDGVEFREEFANAGASWELRVHPVDSNGLDVVVAAQVDPEYWLTAFDAKLMDLNLGDATVDSGWLGQGRRNLPTTKGLLMGPIPGDLRIQYPANNVFAPAAVLQDSARAIGICRLDVHNLWRAPYGELLVGGAGKSREVRVTTGWAEATSTSSLYQHDYTVHYRFRFSAPRAPGPAGYLQLTDAKDLWIDYVKELDQYVPVQARPEYDRKKNNILIMNYFMAEGQYVTPQNPMGWVMNSPDWKSDRWEFPPAAAQATGAELKRLTGFTEENAGPPAKWIKAYAEKNVREMKETDALANVVWRTASLTGANDLSLNYLPDTHYFHDEMEELVPVDGAVRDWDWVVADLEILAPVGAVVARKKAQAIHAANLGALRKTHRFEDLRQRIALGEDDLQPAAAPYVKSASGIGAEELYRDHTKLYFRVLDPQSALVGAKIGSVAEFRAEPMVGDPDLAKRGLKIKATVREVKRAVIDVWAKTLTDAGCEIGFLIREDFLMGPPWHMTFMRLDWTAEWQYDLLRQRVEWHRARFGNRCRWYYLDVFANETPDFVLQRLRRDFPDCFFFVEHPNGVALRTVNCWNWFNIFTPLELYLNPDALALVLPERILSSGYAAIGSGPNRDQDIAFMRHVWKNPNYILTTHRGARDLVRLAQQAQQEK